MSRIEFTIIGEPKPQGRPRKSFAGGIFSPTTEHKERVVAAAYKLKQEGHYFDSAVTVGIAYYFKRPKSHYGTGKNAGVLKKSAPHFNIKRPDLDNLNKAILDAIGDAGLWKDDSLVCYLSSSKHYIENDQYTIIEIEDLTNEQD